uniref:G-protein coupled receptors family 1 profile domain-containing protein n=1 Tax=Panagrolaimus sp. JU765 TaxID=591449 RepID=A0AC34QBR0_9BILA
MVNFFEILPYIVLVEYIITEFAVVMSFFILLRVLHHHHKNRINSIEVSNSMLLYLVCEWIFSFSTFIYVGYMTLWWRSGQQVYNAYILWALGGILASIIVVKPVTVCFLGLDRCFAIIFPLKYRLQRTKYMMIMTLIAVAIFFTINLVYFILPAFPRSSSTNCGAILCLAQDSGAAVYLILRYTISLSILVVGIVFVISARKRLFDTTAVAKVRFLTQKSYLDS